MRATKVIRGKLFYARTTGTMLECERVARRLENLGRDTSIQRTNTKGKYILYVERRELGRRK